MYAHRITHVVSHRSKMGLVRHATVQVKRCHVEMPQPRGRGQTVVRHVSIEEHRDALLLRLQTNSAALLETVALFFVVAAGASSSTGPLVFAGGFLGPEGCATASKLPLL